MQVSVEKTSELSRKLIISVPKDFIQEKVDTRIKSMGQKLKVDGFRPGKAPLHVVKKMYTNQVNEEVVNEFINTSYQDAIKDNELNPTNYPHIQVIDEPDDFKYSAEFEVYPEISLESLSQLEVSRPVSTVTDIDVDNVIEKLRDQRKTWDSVNRPVREHDRVTLEFTGICEGENFTDGKVDGFEVVIGSKQMIPGFEENLEGLETNATKTFELTFPENYRESKLAGKPATFEIMVIKVEAPVLPEIDTEFFKSFNENIDSLDSFRIDVQENLEREMELALRARLKNAILQALYEKLEIPVPKSLIDLEIKNLKKNFLDANKQQNNKQVDLQQLPGEVFEEQAKQRVALALIIGEIIDVNSIKLDEQKVRAAIETMAKSYEHPEMVINWYYSDKSRLNDVQQMVMEEQAIDWIIEQAKISDEQVSFSDIMNNQQRA
jgi:trigger factor